MEIKWIALAAAIAISAISASTAYQKGEYYKCQTVNVECIR